ncbi:uncharacterized protein LOC112467812 [Temnothorax curvispinosus]|uniref:Uncharacterized protein LOC112467812 n=1 Tax=Temnothorax curvispinosus TaxID=300111 RepID=A0A6J1RCC0_9HYME|nr:uncharacterized protein LOC112467812 [Temnothorax curvispinosus]
MLRMVGCVANIGLMVHLNVMIATDWWYGQRDLFGPYPRIPDKDRLKREIEFAKECREFIKPPKACV